MLELLTRRLLGMNNYFSNPSTVKLSTSWGWPAWPQDQLLAVCGSTEAATSPVKRSTFGRPSTTRARSQSKALERRWLRLVHYSYWECHRSTYTNRSSTTKYLENYRKNGSTFYWKYSRFFIVSEKWLELSVFLPAVMVTNGRAMTLSKYKKSSLENRRYILSRPIKPYYRM